MMKVEATVTTGVLDQHDLVDVHICVLTELSVTATVEPWERRNGWIYGRPILFKKGKWSYG